MYEIYLKDLKFKNPVMFFKIVIRKNGGRQKCENSDVESGIFLNLFISGRCVGRDLMASSWAGRIYMRIIFIKLQKVGSNWDWSGLIP